MVHLVGRDLHHFVFEVDRVTRWPHVVFPRPLDREAASRRTAPGEVRRRGQRELKLPARLNLAAEIERREVARPVARCVSIGDVFGKQPLALLVPVHPRAQHRKDRQIGDRHGGSPAFLGSQTALPR